MARIESWQDGCLSVERLGNFLEQLTSKIPDSFGHLKSCRRDSIFVTLTQFKTNRMMRKGVQTGYDIKTTLQKRKPIEFEYSTF